MYRKNRRLRDVLRHSKKTLVMLMAMIIAFSGAIGGTLAWLTAETQTIHNTFTVGDIKIKLEESDADHDGDKDNNRYEMLPGESINKDPKVTVLAGSKACWLFAKLDKSVNFDKYLSYEIASGWTALENVSGVYYREVSASNTDQPYQILKDDTVKVHADADFSNLISGTETEPKLNITAYAVQRDSVNSAADAWKLVPATATAPQDAAEPVLVPATADTSIQPAALTEEEESALAWKAFLDSGADA